MNSTEENPYAAPRASGLAKAEPREGALWSVSEGVLHFRDGASLPDVCLSGASSSEPGERHTLTLDWCPAWARHVPEMGYLCLMIWFARQLKTDDASSGGYSLLIMLLVGIALPAALVRLTGKRARLHVFQSEQAKRIDSRRFWLENAPVSIMVIGGCLILNRIYPDFIQRGGLIFMICLPTSIIGLLERRYKVRAVEFENGWFALANVNPAAIAQFQEIESRISKTPLSRNPS